MKVLIYSAMFGGYDAGPYNIFDLHRNKVHFRWFTDDQYYKRDNSNTEVIDYKQFMGWTTKYVDNYITNDKYKYAKTNRFYKLQPNIILEPSDINVYIDSNKKLFNIDMLLGYCQELYDNPDLDAIFCRHTERDTVQQEVREVARLRRDEPARVMRQYKEYRDEGFPDNIPLIVASVQIRKTHAPALQSMLDCWWNEVLHKSYRDQISLPYAIWKTGFTRYRTINVWTERLKMIANSEHRKVLHI